MNKQEQIDEYNEKIRALEQELASERLERLKSLHTELGFESNSELIEALQKLRGGRRSRLSAATRAQVQEDLKAGMSGSKVAAKHAVSVPTVQLIKKDLGLVRRRRAASVSGEKA